MKRSESNVCRCPFSVPFDGHVGVGLSSIERGWRHINFMRGKIYYSKDDCCSPPIFTVLFLADMDHAFLLCSHRFIISYWWILQLRICCLWLAFRSVGFSSTKGQLPRRRWENNIKMGLSEIGMKGVDWIHLIQNQDRWRALVDTVMNLRVSWKAQNSLTSWAELLKDSAPWS
jgi:hypothetical protein